MDTFGVTSDFGADDAVSVGLRGAAYPPDTVRRLKLDVQRADAGAIVRTDAECGSLEWRFCAHSYAMVNGWGRNGDRWTTWYGEYVPENTTRPER